MTVIHAIRAPDAEPTLEEFQYRLELAMRGGMILCTLGFTREVLDALDAVAMAGRTRPNSCSTRGWMPSCGR